MNENVATISLIAGLIDDKLTDSELIESDIIIYVDEENATELFNDPLILAFGEYLSEEVHDGELLAIFTEVEIHVDFNIVGVKLQEFEKEI